MLNKVLAETIVKYLEEKTTGPNTAEELVLGMKLKGNDLKNIWTVLEEMERDGSVVKTRFATYGLPKRMGMVVGIFQLTSKGFGFILAENKDDKDVFIPPNAVMGAMNGDKVMARLNLARGTSRPEGEIIRIITRAHTRMVGTFTNCGEFGFVVPDDRKLGRDIYVRRGDMMKAQTNQKVVLEITQWPEERRNAEGKIVEILGTVGDVGLEIVSIIKENNLPLEFPPQVLSAAKKVPMEIKNNELAGRRDLRDLPMVTIDGEDAKDLDDAVYVEKQGDKYLLGVYIADVSYYVRKNTVLDEEALERGTSVYLVDRVLPMLPERLSNGICSLNAGEDRLAMACEMLLSPKGELLSYDIFPAIINVEKRLSYRQVREVLVDNNPETTQELEALLPQLKVMEALCGILRARRDKRGAIDFDLPEQKVILDEKKHPIEIVPRVRSIAESIIEEFMLCANETVAQHMTKAKWPFIYRVHDVPSEEKMTKLATLLGNFGVTMPISEEMQPITVQKALAAMKGKPEEKLITTVALRSLKQAVYQTDNLGHFGLAAENYTHFTSPIRRYPDLMVHRLLRQWMDKPVISAAVEEGLTNDLDYIAQHCSEKERAAAEAERATVELKMAEYMYDHVGEEFEGIISGVTAFGMFVELANGVEGMVHISSLTDDYYEYAEDVYSLVGEHTNKHYRLGDKITIEVLQVDIQERNVDFILAGESAGNKEYIKEQMAKRNKQKGKGFQELEHKSHKKSHKNKKKSKDKKKRR